MGGGFGGAGGEDEGDEAFGFGAGDECAAVAMEGEGAEVPFAQNILDGFAGF